MRKETIKILCYIAGLHILLCTCTTMDDYPSIKGIGSKSFLVETKTIFDENRAQLQ